MLKRMGYLILIAIIFGGFNLWWTSRTVDENNRKWCSLVTTLDKADHTSTTPPKPGTFTAQLIPEIHTLKVEFRCAG